MLDAEGALADDCADGEAEELICRLDADDAEELARLVGELELFIVVAMLLLRDVRDDAPEELVVLGVDTEFPRELVEDADGCESETVVEPDG